MRDFTGTRWLAVLGIIFSAARISVLFFYTMLEKKIQLLTVKERIAQIISAPSAHFLLALLLIIAFVTVVYEHKGKSAHQSPDIPAGG